MGGNVTRGVIVRAARTFGADKSAEKVCGLIVDDPDPIAGLIHHRCPVFVCYEIPRHPWPVCGIPACVVFLDLTGLRGDEAVIRPRGVDCREFLIPWRVHRLVGTVIVERGHHLRFKFGLGWPSSGARAQRWGKFGL